MTRSLQELYDRRRMAYAIGEEATRGPRSRILHNRCDLDSRRQAGKRAALTSSMQNMCIASLPTMTSAGPRFERMRSTCLKDAKTKHEKRLL
jgi:hypothetical protein